MKLGANLLTALTNSAWTAILGLAVVPLYLKYLGLESYGLIGFFSSMQALLIVLDMGLSQTINREVARLSVSNGMPEARNLLHTLACVYLATAIGIALLIYFLSPSIAEDWLRPTALDAGSLSRAIMIMGLVLACRWPIGLYQGAIIGMQRLALSSKISMGIVTLGNLGAVAVLAWVSPTIEAFFVWQGCVALLHVGLVRSAAWRVLGREGSGKFNLNALKRVWRFSVSISGVTASALVLSQLDKLILSKMLPLKEFAIYMLATTIVGSLYLLISPVFNVIFPLFTAMVATGDSDKLARSYRQGSRALASALFPLALLLAIASEGLVRLWTGQSLLAERVAPLIMIMTAGSALHGMMYFPYALQLANGMPRLPLTINLVLMTIVVPLTWVLTAKFGLLGGAGAWLALHLIYFLFGTWLTNRHLLRGLAVKWILSDIGIPLGICVVSAIPAALFLRAASSSTADQFEVAIGVVTSLIAFLCIVVAAPVSRSWLTETFLRQAEAAK